MLTALRALTTLPLGPERGRARLPVLFLPLAGLAVGIGWAMAGQVVDLYRPTTVAAALVLLVDALLTGGRHLAALGRLADGLDPAGPRDGALGATGATAIVLVTLLRFGVLVFAVDFAMVLLAVPVAGRAGMGLMLATGSAPVAGRLAPLGRPSLPEAGAAAAITLVLVAVLAGPPALVGAAVALLLAVAAGVLLRARPGAVGPGLTSDTVFAGGILVETLVLLAAVAG